jgi:NmrA-like family
VSQLIYADKEFYETQILIKSPMCVVHESGSAAGETAQGTAIADAAHAAGVSFFIYSSLPNVSKFSNGKVTHVHHFDSKAAVEEYARTLQFPSSAFIWTGWYMQNVWDNIMAQPKVVSLSVCLILMLVCLLQLDDGTVLFNFAWTPATLIPYIDITDIGKYLSPALRNPEKYNGARFTASTAFYSAQEIVDTWSEVSGKKIVLPTEADIPTLTDDPIKQQYARIGNLFREWGYFGPTGQKDLEWTLAQMDEQPTTWKQFLEANGPWFE